MPKKCMLQCHIPAGWRADRQAADDGLTRRLAYGDRNTGAAGCAIDKAVHEQEDDDMVLPRPNKATTPL